MVDHSLTKSCLNCNKPPASRGIFCGPACRVAYNRRKRNNTVTAIDLQNRTILSICDFTGAWSEPYRRAGYRVIQWDIQHGQDARLQHYPGQVWGVLAAPPCTMFSLAGNRAWAEGKRSEADLLNALAVVDACLRQVAIGQPKWWALENPLGRLSHYLGKPRLIFQPYWYGASHSKRTCLWGNFNRPKPSPVECTKSLINTVRKAQDRATTPKEFAQAFFEANP